MISHYLRSTWRTIRRNPLYSFISIGCLAIGVAVSLTILLYVLHEHSYDRWQARSERIYSVMTKMKFGDAEFNIERMSFSTGPLVQQADADVESYFRLYANWGSVTVQYPINLEESYSEKGTMAYVDSNFFSFFSYRLKRGDPRHVLDKPSSLVLSERLAIVIACPVSWWVMHRWLEDFAYRTSLSWWVFAGAGLGLLAVALATVLVRSFRAGRANPVENLRSE